MNISEKRFVVTGGGSGIGRELTLGLIHRGADVVAVDISEDALQETVKLAGEEKNRIETAVVNIAEQAAVEQLKNDLQNKNTAIDGVINNAGIIQPFVKVEQLQMEDIERVMNVNFYGTLYMTKAFLPGLLKRPEAHIVNVSSMGGFLPVPGQSVYGASKAAVKLLTEGLYAELQDTNVHVTVVFPGATQTNIAKNSGVDIAADASAQEHEYAALPASEAAKRILQAVEQNAFRVCVGKDSKAMDVLYRLSPRFATRFIAKKMKSLLK